MHEYSENEKEISSISRNENDVSGNENFIFGNNNESESPNDNCYIFKSPNNSDINNINDSCDVKDSKNNINQGVIHHFDCNTFCKNENDNNIKKNEFYKEEPLIEEANLENTSENTKLFLKKKKKRAKKDESDKDSIKDKGSFKYSIDNITRRLKSMILNSMLQFDNDVILKTYNYNIGRGVNTKKLIQNDFSQKRDTKIDFNKNLLYKTQQEIFSAKISNKYKGIYFNDDHNKIMIENLLKEKDEKIRNIFQNLFSKTLKECILQICGKKPIKCLEGLEHIFVKNVKEMKQKESFKKQICILQICNYKPVKCLKNLEPIYKKKMEEMKEETNFIKQVNELLNNYEKILNDRVPRKRKKD